MIARIPHSSGLLSEQVTPETELGEDDHRGFRPDEWYEMGWEKLEKLRCLERDGERTMGQAAIQWLLAHNAVASITPAFHATIDIDEWAVAPETPPFSEMEVEQVASLYKHDFGIDRDDGMAGLKSSVDGTDLTTIEAKQAED